MKISPRPLPRQSTRAQPHRVGLSDPECVALLQWACPRLGLRWDGFRTVRGQVCKRIARRMRALALSDVTAYRVQLEGSSDEWAELEAMCRVTISRFYRDRAVWQALLETLLPGRAAAAVAEGRALRCWSAGCASGEEPYSLALVLEKLRVNAPRLRYEILATDADTRVLERARAGCYPRGTLRELPRAWLAGAFREGQGGWCVEPALRAHVRLERQDIRRVLPDGPFDLILCRNLVFTYFAPEVQATLGRALIERLGAGGLLVIGAHERPRAELPGMVALTPLPIFQQRDASPARIDRA